MSYILRSAGFAPGGSPSWPLSQPPCWRGFSGAADTAATMWWQPGDVLALDFGNNRYMHDGATSSLAAVVSVSRTSAATWFTGAGVLQSFDPNVPAITDRGLYVSGQFTNKIAAYNFAPSAVALVNASSFNALGVPGVTAAHGGGGSLGQFGVVADAENVAATGLGAVCNGNVFSIDMTGDPVGSGRLTFSDAVGNTNAHSWGAWVRNDTVDATLRMIGSASYGQVNLTPGPEYSYVKVENWTPDATAKFVPQIGFSGRLWLFGMQLVESSFLPPPIVTTGSAATRLADSITIPDFAAKAAAFGFDGGFAGKAVVDLARLSDGAYRLLFDFGTDTSNRAYLGVAPDNSVELSVKAAGAGPVLNTAALGAPGLYTLEWQVLSGDSFIKVNGAVAASSGDTFTMPGLSSGYIGHSRSGGSHLNGPLRELHLRGVAA